MGSLKAIPKQDYKIHLKRRLWYWMRNNPTATYNNKIAYQPIRRQNAMFKGEMLP